MRAAVQTVLVEMVVTQGSSEEGYVLDSGGMYPARSDVRSMKLWRTMDAVKV